eukprot:jgi/Picre1/33041/NNA_008367.t1
MSDRGHVPLSSGSGKDTSKIGATPLPEHSNKLKSFRIRLYSTIVLIASFSFIIYAGHVPLMGMVLAIQTVMVKELFQLAREAQRERSLPGFRAQQWYFYFVAAFWVYVRFIKNNLIVEITSSAALSRLLGTMIRRHTLISFSLYTGGFVCFWFFFGRTPLIKLSPKKTWEGFIGGFVGTLIASWFLSGWMSQSAWLTCPRTDLSIFQPMECTEPPETFQPRDFNAIDILSLFAEHKFIKGVEFFHNLLPADVQSWINSIHIHAAPMQFHAIALALFASAIAPFGGFFASGFKRGFNIKDFGHSIPGHGGMTDRMDCQVVMATFSYIYYHAFTDRSAITLGSVLTIALKLKASDQIELFLHMAHILESQGYLPPTTSKAISGIVDDGVELGNTTRYDE